MEMVECSLGLGAATRAHRTMLGRVSSTPAAAVLGAGRARRLRVRSLERNRPVVRASAQPEHDGGRALTQAAAGLAVAAAAVVSLTGDFVVAPPPARAESLTVAFPVSRAREVNRVQRTLVEAWGLIRETFVDPTFNHQGPYTCLNPIAHIHHLFFIPLLFRIQIKVVKILVVFDPAYSYTLILMLPVNLILLF